MANEIVQSLKTNLTGDAMLGAIEKVLPKGLLAEKLIQVSINALVKSPKLLQCSKPSIYKAVMECAQLGLVPDGVLGDAYFVPYKNTCQLIPGYRGMMRLAINSGKVSHIFAENVFSKDEFDYAKGLFPRLEHVPSHEEDRGDFVGAYAVGNLIDNPSHPAFEYMPAREIDAIRNRAKAKDNGPWKTDFLEMTKKTVVRRLCKFLPLSPEAMTTVMRGEYHDAGVLDVGKPAPMTEGVSDFGFTQQVDVTVDEDKTPEDKSIEDAFPE
jgi:recombination protein RecT